jgi:hypothetical protein
MPVEDPFIRGVAYAGGGVLSAICGAVAAKYALPVDAVGNGLPLAVGAGCALGLKLGLVGPYDECASRFDVAMRGAMICGGAYSLSLYLNGGWLQ